MDRLRALYYWIPDRMDDIRDWWNNVGVEQASTAYAAVWSVLAGPWRMGKFVVRKITAAAIYGWGVIRTFFFKAKTMTEDVAEEAFAGGDEVETVADNDNATPQTHIVIDSGEGSMLRSIGVYAVVFGVVLGGSFGYVWLKKRQWQAEADLACRQKVAATTNKKNAALGSVEAVREGIARETERRIEAGREAVSKSLAAFPDKKAEQCGRDCSIPADDVDRINAIGGFR